MSGSLAAAMLGMAAMFIVVIIAYYVLCVVGRWKLFSKMGEPGWKALIPFYSDYIIFKNCWDVRAFFLLIVFAAVEVFLNGSAGLAGTAANIASFLALAIAAISNYKLSLCFGHGIFFALGLYFLNPIFVIILGFGTSEFDREAGNNSYF